MTVGILGSGFGIYGYLPAVVLCGRTPILLERYRKNLELRPELQAFRSKVTWVSDEDKLFNCAHALVICRRPMDQLTLVPALLQHCNIGRILLEKPLAPDPAQARVVLESLEAAGRIVRIGFTFRETEWARRLAEWARAAGAESSLTINWRFRAHHFAHDLSIWKRRHSQGGGTLRFYGIQLIALLAELGYSKVVNSRLTWAAPDEDSGWEAVMAGRNGSSCRVEVDSNAEVASFTIDMTGGLVPDIKISLRDPFDGSGAPDGLDRRVGVLASLCRSLLDDSVPLRRHSFDLRKSWFSKSIDLWQSVELKSGATGNNMSHAN